MSAPQYIQNNDGSMLIGKNTHGTDSIISSYKGGHNFCSLNANCHSVISMGASLAEEDIGLKSPQGQ